MRRPGGITCSSITVDNKKKSNIKVELILVFLSGCEKDVQKVCSDSPEEHLQPFKDRMEAFLLSGEQVMFCKKKKCVDSLVSGNTLQQEKETRERNVFENANQMWMIFRVPASISRL